MELNELLRKLAYIYDQLDEGEIVIAQDAVDKLIMELETQT